jgi:hypothetical protein
MSHPEEPLGRDDATGHRDGLHDTKGSPESTDPTGGLLGRLKRHARTWSRKYVEMRVAARTGRRR